MVGPDGNAEKALRKFKKKIADSKLLDILRDKEFYTKPTMERKIAKARAISRWKRLVKSEQLPEKKY
jgi:small subunit ribosomal protein S21